MRPASKKYMDYEYSIPTDCESSANQVRIGELYSVVQFKLFDMKLTDIGSGKNRLYMSSSLIILALERRVQDFSAMSFVILKEIGNLVLSYGNLVRPILGITQKDSLKRPVYAKNRTYLCANSATRFPPICVILACTDHLGATHCPERATKSDIRLDSALHRNAMQHLSNILRSCKPNLPETQLTQCPKNLN